MNAATRVKWAIDFAIADLDSLLPGDWMNLRHGLAQFLGCVLGEGVLLEDKGGIVAIPTEHPYPEDFPKDSFRQLQTETKGLLQNVAKPLDWIKSEGPKVWTGQVHGVRLPNAKLSVVGYGDNTAAFFCEGATREVFLSTLLFLLASQPSKHIGICSECSEIFYRTRMTGRYCGTTCTNRAGQRSYRKRRAQAEELRAQGQTAQQIAAALDTDVKTVQGWIKKGEANHGKR